MNQDTHSGIEVFWLALIIVISSTIMLYLNIEIDVIKASKFILFPHPENAS